MEFNRPAIVSDTTMDPALDRPYRAFADRSRLLVREARRTHAALEALYIDSADRFGLLINRARPRSERHASCGPGRAGQP